MIEVVDFWPLVIVALAVFASGFLIGLAVASTHVISKMSGVIEKFEAAVRIRKELDDMKVELQGTSHELNSLLVHLDKAPPKNTKETIDRRLETN